MGSVSKDSYFLGILSYGFWFLLSASLFVILSTSYEDNISIAIYSLFWHNIVILPAWFYLRIKKMNKSSKSFLVSCCVYLVFFFIAFQIA
ncbi:MAG: hypothetical protein COA57_14420 [Flavobacteriales bacterium]|nr:MAG: hypothetical protein COA57_14420 [Flavobacteriales bacterium]